MRLSIIIPVYNTDPAKLQRCLESFSDAPEDIEVVIVNDGSDSPGTNEVLRHNMLFGNPVFHIVEQENKGVSAARNLGMDASSGEWLTFCDADDEIDLSLLNHTIDFAENSEADMVYSDYCKQSRCGQTIELLDCNRNQEYTELLLKQPNLYGTAWGKLFRRERVMDIFFDEDLSHSEDAVFLLRCMAAGINVRHDVHHYYQHYVYEHSSAKMKRDAINQYVRAMETAEKVTAETFPDLLGAVNDFCNTNLLIMLVNYIFDGRRSYCEGRKILEQLRSTAIVRRSLSNIHLPDRKNRFVLNAIRKKNDLLCWLAAGIRRNMR